MNWIFNSPLKDSVFLIFPWLLGIIFYIIGPEHLFTLAIIYGLLDSGHVYTTGLRIYWKKNDKAKLLALFLFIWIFISLWIYNQLPHFWAFVVYSTLFHHIRQYFGILKWYQKINNKFDQKQVYALYLLTLLPVICYHFRQNISGHYYTEGDLFLFPSPLLFQVGLFAIFVVFVAWVLHERNSNNSIPSKLLIFSTASLYAFAALLAENISLTLSLLILGHTIPYLALMTKSVEKLRSLSIFASSGIVLLIALLFGGMEFIGEDHIYNFAFQYQSISHSLLASMGIALFITPLISHFAYDAILWKKTDEDMKKIVELN